MKEKIKEIMASVLNIEIDKISDNSSPDTIEAWDSLKQMDLIISIEEEFNIEFSDEELVVDTYAGLVKIVKDNL